ncbi:Fe-S cluster assembly protein SufD [Proteus myxofaciens]|uniref:Iron-sulfur cluster assembly protein n=1 Tax=Proteus myxofaciens ATCC 19692 TaxID=1354337 RepID=A0A198F9E4_9GAMM|nr:Fe-S cluster assembly protein SufD [Proteus myxofaciens]OAT21498.1 iron-sulfur cluster assembly protein [Proteus myxofaciens ATCC 19692]
MAGLLTLNEKREKQEQVEKRNQQALEMFSSLYQQRKGDNNLNARHHWQQVEKVGFPVYRHEDWHYTPLEETLSQHYQQLAAFDVQDLVEQQALAFDCYRIVMVNGTFSPSESSKDFGPYQVTLLDNQSELPEAINGEIFLHLVESLAPQPLLISLKKGTIADKPLYILNITQGNEGSEVNSANYRFHLDIGANTQMQVIEHYISNNNQNRHFTGARLTANIGDNASFKHIKLSFENEISQHFAHNDMMIGRDARVHSYAFLLGGKLSRHHTSSALKGENTELSMNSVVLPKAGEIADTRTWLEHGEANCQSRQLHKSIAMDAGKAVFNGMITVMPNALKTDGQMTNNNLLLGEKAQIDTKPQLEIYADDVKCSHGATVGCIDEEQLFYLRSRGIPLNAARKMIIHAFAAELTESIENSVIRKHVLDRINQRLLEV